jgi:hypothetical protein
MISGSQSSRRPQVAGVPPKINFLGLHIAGVACKRWMKSSVEMMGSRTHSVKTAESALDLLHLSILLERNMEAAGSTARKLADGMSSGTSPSAAQRSTWKSFRRSCLVHEPYLPCGGYAKRFLLGRRPRYPPNRSP